MNDNLLHSELAALLSGAPYSELAALMQPEGADAPQIYGAQAGADIVRPTLTISGQYTPYGPRRMGDLTFELRSRLRDADAHQDRIFALIRAFLGPTAADFLTAGANRNAALAAMQAAIEMRGRVKIINFGAGPNFLEATFEGEDLITTMVLKCAWQFLV